MGGIIHGKLPYWLNGEPMVCERKEWAWSELHLQHPLPYLSFSHGKGGRIETLNVNKINSFRSLTRGSLLYCSCDEVQVSVYPDSVSLYRFPLSCSLSSSRPPFLPWVMPLLAWCPLLPLALHGELFTRFFLLPACNSVVFIFTNIHWRNLFKRLSCPLFHHDHGPSIILAGDCLLLV